MEPLGPVASICATPANRWMDGRQMLGYVMNFANRQVSKAKNIYFMV